MTADLNYWLDAARDLRSREKHRDAVVVAAQGLALHPGSDALLSSLGELMELGGARSSAFACFRRACSANPLAATHHANLATLYERLGHAGLISFRKALALAPAFVEAMTTGANMFRMLGTNDLAMRWLLRGLAIDADHAYVRWNMSLLRLLHGDYGRGWPDYEWRWYFPEHGVLKTSAPQWRGEALVGRSLLLWAEQGAGDVLQFLRYVPSVAALGAQILLRAPSHLSRILRTIPGIDRVIDADDPLPPFDFHCPLMSLPLALGASTFSIPTSIPYVRPDSALIEEWRSLIGDHGMKIGIAWQANISAPTGQARSLPGDALVDRLMRAPVRLFSLQRGISPPAADVVDLGPFLRDFADTVAVVSCLDLVITADTALAHVAGSLGRPVWVFIALLSDWRWLLDRRDSPWYPTARLFRQERPGDWSTALHRVAAELAAFTPCARDIGESSPAERPTSTFR
jgi:hypothetical protein